MSYKETIELFLQENGDLVNAEFQSKLIFSKYKIWGIKTPILENFVKDLIKKGLSYSDFDFKSHEEILMGGMFIAKSKITPSEKVELLKKWLNYVDNWATCDQIVCRLKGMESEIEFFKSLLNSEKTFIQRFGIIYLMRFNLKNDLKDSILKILEVGNQDYYIKMAKAWSLAEAILVDYEYIKNIIETIDDKFLRNKAISKACESFRVSDSQKVELRELRIK